MKMNHPIRLFSLMGLMITLSSAVVWSQSGREFRRTAVHNANQVRTVFGNWGVIGQPCEAGPRGSWKNDNDGYLGDVSPMVGAEVDWQGRSFHSVVTCPVQRPTALADTDPRTGKYWTFEPVSGYLNPNQEKIAMSTNRISWPPFWPDKLGDPNDPGWKGSWNGYFGKRANADQESYFVMDDNNDERFNFATNNFPGVAFKPDSTNLLRNGLGLEVRVRGLQWAQFLAKDNIFWLYEIKNTGTTNYNKVAFGMIVGTYVGVTGCSASGNEWDDDWSFYDVTTNLTYTGDFDRNNNANPLWVGPVGMVGYAFLESPGNPFDGIDNDGDADSISFASAAPKFTSASFDSSLIFAGTQLVLIDTNFARTLFTVPNVESVLVHTRGLRRWIYSGRTKVAEGNILRDASGNEFINPNAYDGIDNDFDGIVDENFYLHFHQIKKTRRVPPETLIDVLRPLRHIEYTTGAGMNPYSMIDEKRNDLIDNNQDWEIQYDDVGRDGIPSTGDYGESDGFPTSGYDNSYHDTGLPGEPHIDKTDVRESDQIGLTSFFYFTPAGDVRLGDDESLWRDLAPGFFDVPLSIKNNRPETGQDGDFIYGSGYFPLLAGSTERFSLALVYGGGRGGGIDDDITDLLKNKKTVQKIYDANYQFPQPPDKPTLTAVPGDHQVTLYWDRRAEASLDPVLRIKDFEGYKIYRSTDPNFSDIFTITDANGSPQGYRPLAQFDLKDGLPEYFRSNPELFEATSGYSYFLGNDNGIVHSYVDKDVENGKRYFYAVVAYDRGDEVAGIFPSENTKFVTVLPTGEIDHDANVAVVTPNAPVAGFILPADGIQLGFTTRIATGSAYYKVTDETRLTGHPYQVEFLDTQVDSVDNNKNGIVDAADSTEWSRITSFYSVRDMSDIVETFFSGDTAVVYLMHKNIIPSTVVVRNEANVEVSPAAYRLDAAKGSIRGVAPGTLPSGTYTVSFQYYPVYKSPYIQGTPFLTESKDADIFDGTTLVFQNDWNIIKIDTASGWIGKNAYIYNFSTFETEISQGQFVRGVLVPNDYEIRFSDRIVDTSYADPFLLMPATPVNFRVYNLTDSSYMKFILSETSVNGKISPGDELILVENNPRGGLSYTWDIWFSAKIGDPLDTVYNLTTGDKLVLKTTKPFRKGDVLSFTTVPPRIDQGIASTQLSRIKVVPNPYVAASSHEPPLPPGRTVGRERRIEFIHLPASASIKIFTARGELVRALHHDGNIEDGTVAWDLKSDENLDIAFGIYFYVVESPSGTKTGKIAIIK